MLNAHRKITALTALGLVFCLLAASPANANPEKDLYDRDVSDRTLAYEKEVIVFVADDDFRAPPPPSNFSTGSIDKVAKCSRQTPSLCPPKSKPSH